MDSTADISDVYSRRSLWWRRLAGLLLMGVLMGLGGAIDASNPPLTLDGFGVGAMLGAPLVVPIVVEILLQGVPDDVEVSVNWIPGLPGRLITYSIISSICWFLLGILLLLFIGVVTTMIPSIQTFPGASSDGSIPLALGFSGLFVSWLLPLRLLTARNVTLERTGEFDPSIEDAARENEGKNRIDDQPTGEDKIDSLQEELKQARKSYINNQLTEASSTLQDLQTDLERSLSPENDSTGIEAETTKLRLKLHVAETIKNRDQTEAALNENDLEGAQSAVEAASKSLTEATEIAAQEDLSTEPLQELRSTIEDLKTDVKELREEQEAFEQLNGLLDSVASERKQAKEFLQAGKMEKALLEIKSALDTCSEATQINEDHELGREKEITDLESDIEDLASDVVNQFEQELEQQFDDAKRALSENDVETVLSARETIDDVLTEHPKIDREVNQEIVDTASEFKQRLQDQIESFVSERISTAKQAHETSADLIAEGEYKEALTRAEEGIEACEEASVFDEITQDNITTELEELGEELETVRTNADTLPSLIGRAKKQREATQRAIKARVFESAEEALADLEATIDQLRENDVPGMILDGFSSDISELEEKIAANREKSRVDGLLGSVTSAHQQVEELLEEGSHDRALRRLESAQRSLNEAADLNGKYRLGRDTAISDKRDRNEELLEIAESQPAEEVKDLLEAAEDLVSQGIEHRDRDDLNEALEAFESAHTKYETALSLANEHDLPQQWEIQQRHSMVAEYRDITQSEWDDKRQTALTGIDEALDEAESQLVRAEQHAEVEDHTSARESLTQALGYLDEATQLFKTGIEAGSLQQSYDDLADRANTLHGQLPSEEELGEYRTSDLVESLQVLATKLGESPRPEFVNAYGEYPADAYLEAFGSWPEALAAANLDPIDEAARERRTYSRVEILDALSRVAEDLGRPPSKSEMNQHGEMSASPVQSRFSDWDTALELAGITDEYAEPRSDSPPPSSEGKDRAGSTSDSDLQPNELAEVYDVFGILKSTLESLIAADESISEGDGSPLAKWYAAIYERWGGSGVDGAPNYGYQQANRNNFSLKEYREVYGDGERVTEFHEIEVRPLFDYDRKVLREFGIIDESETLPQPVPPESDIRLPIVVRKESRLSKGLEMLDEFPAWPAAETEPNQGQYREESVEPEETEHREEVEETKSGPDKGGSDGDEDDIVQELLQDMDLGSDGEPAHE